MVKMNENYSSLKENYLFSEIATRVKAYSEAHPDKKIIRMGIGDVTLPLCDIVIKKLQEGVCDMATAEGFHGYGPEQGYAFLRDNIKEYYAGFGVTLESDEIFVSDGAKSDVGNILDLFSTENTILVTDPVYPVYVDTNLMGGRQLVYVPANEENGFLPLPDESISADIVYLCSPNNPTGAAYRREQLKLWVDYVNRMGAILLFDAAYEAFVSEDGVARSIFEIEGSKTCAIEFCSLSKTAGFTGTRCGYTVVPKALVRNGFSLNRMWFRRQSTKFNGVSYIVQKGAQAVFTEQGIEQTRRNLAYYKKNAQIITKTLDRLQILYFGGKNSPYIWLKCPNGMKSWEFFDFLLEKANVVGTPGAGFGACGEGYFRLTSFSTHENTQEAMERLEKEVKNVRTEQ